MPSCPGDGRTMLVNVCGCPSAPFAPGPSGGGSSGGAGPSDSALSAARCACGGSLGLFLVGQLCCGRCTGSAGRDVAALSPGSRANASTPERAGPPSSRHGLWAARGAEPIAPAARAAEPPGRGLPRAVSLRRDARGLRAPRADVGLAAGRLPTGHNRAGADGQQPDGAAAGAAGQAARAARGAPERQSLALRLPPGAAARLAGRPPRAHALPGPALRRAPGAAGPPAALPDRGGAARRLLARRALLGGAGGAAGAAGSRAAARAAAGAAAAPPAKAARPRRTQPVAERPAHGGAGR